MRAMVGKRIAPVSVDNASRRVSEALFGNDWIDGITEREAWLIERYVEGRGRQGARSTMPDMSSWIMGGRRWSEYPSDPALVAETEKARDRNDWCNDQWEKALDWLQDYGFDTTADTVDPGALEAALQKAFQSRNTERVNKGGRPAAVDWDVVKEEVIRLMDYHGEFGSDLPEWNAQARLVERIEGFCETKFKVRPAASTIHTHLTPWLVEWKNSRPRRSET
jgi:hypothetical protein